MVMKTKRKQTPIFSMLKELETGQAFSPAVKGPPETEQIEPSFSERKQTSKTYRVEQRTAPESSEDGKYALVDPEKAIQLASVLIQMARTGRLKEKLNDEQLKQILTMLQEKKDFTIKRK